MLIVCPHCGERPIDEFVELGAADPVRPAADAGIAAFADYVYARENPAGRHREVFHHIGGCRTVLVVERDTRTHEIFAVRSAEDGCR
jgi:heterotetrameric sarcosine oxidase delta subunit